jgi:hypothetical protein
VSYRAITECVIDGMIDAIHEVVDMRARDEDEETVSVMLMERVSLMKALIETKLDEEDD